ncbi:Imm27 family immunity protein [Leptospira weilii]|uniref:Imm27 family immunity protein n=1 Tax=Leptospira weilii TaxID=28184 RepID=UPI0007748087|nr:Imm27 family immunity protein [Leptospira weilii]
MIKKLLPSEKEIIGSQITDDSGTQHDSNISRVIYLIENYLIKIKTDSSGWNTLYQDPEDGRYWEATYLDSDMHGGGPISLVALSDNHAKKKFKLS